MDHSEKQDRTTLKTIARAAMIEKGLLPDFSPDALAELGRINESAHQEEGIRDLRNLPWASIDNDDSRDLDQLSVAETAAFNAVKILVAIADVDALVKRGSALDEHARHNTTSVYTAAEIFPMLPEKLSTDLTSLGYNADRVSIVVEMTIGSDGSLRASEVYRARVRNHAKLTYNGVAAWLEGHGGAPREIDSVSGLAENLRIQDRAAQSLKTFRHIHGALSLETIEVKPSFEGDEIRSLEVAKKNRATEIIEDFMIAANGVIARFLAARQFPSIRRVVRTPKRWERIVQIAAEHSFKLPTRPDAKALEEFLLKMKTADPLRFPDLSLAVVKLLGSGEYVAELPGEDAPGHFGLAVKDYTHSTAPNRRFPDVITQRLLKAALDGKDAPYGKDELDALAAHCTQAEDAAGKVERQVGKSAAALLLESRIGEQFDAIVTGASVKGTWVRLLTVPVEGRLVQGFDGVDIGNRIRVELMAADVQKGFIDFRKLPFARAEPGSWEATR